MKKILNLFVNFADYLCHYCDKCLLRAKSYIMRLMSKLDSKKCAGLTVHQYSRLSAISDMNIGTECPANHKCFLSSAKVITNFIM